MGSWFGYMVLPGSLNWVCFAEHGNFFLAVKFLFPDVIELLCLAEWIVLV